MKKDARILVTGGNGFVGQWVIRELKKRGYKNFKITKSSETDLRNFKDCQLATKNIDVVIHLAATVGGIGYNRSFPAKLFYDNLTMGIHLLHEAYLSGVKKFVGIGTVCAYPKYTPTPFQEDNLWQGYPEETNAPYGLSKKMLLVGSQAYRSQHGFNAIYLLPVNMYGPGDNFNLKSSHVIPALIRKIHQAQKNRQKSVTVWGTGLATREFLYVEDAAQAIVLAMEKYDKGDPANIGSGEEIKITDLVNILSEELGFKGTIIWDKTRPDGQPRRLLNVEKAYKEFGFKAKTPFKIGLRKTIKWYLKTYAT